MLNDALTAKRLELLRELVPNAATIAFLINPDNRNDQSHARILEAAARAGGQHLIGSRHRGRRRLRASLFGTGAAAGMKRRSLILQEFFGWSF
jgi:hypothetical protein